jgi:CRISPR/Cas system-associated exonuclease Cas4 (RecB family)
MPREFDLFQATEDHMTRSRLSLPRGIHYYPSEASVTWVDSHENPCVSGSCLRKSFFRATGREGAEGYDAYMQWIFALGKAVEKILVEEWKQMGILVANNIRFYDAEHNISGEVDVIVRDHKGNNVCIEAKSFYGYYAEKEICGNYKKQGRPKDSHLLQLLVYLYKCRDHFPYGKLMYKARDSDKRAEFDVKLHDVEGGLTRFSVNGVLDYRFTIEDIFSRYKLLDDHVKSMTIPENDFELVWDAEKVERKFQLGEVGKTKYNNWKSKKEKLGDWQCRYCNYTKVCFTRGKPNIITD